MSRQSGPWWRLRAPATVLVIALCTLWTMRVLWGDTSLENAGAIKPESLWAGEWTRIPTSIILHGNWVHLLINCLSLFFVGRVLEPALGRAAYLFFLLASAVAGVAGSLAWNDADIYRVGISGGIAGLIGLVLALEWSITRSVREFFRQRNTIVVLVLLALNAAYAVWVGTVQGARIDHAGHIGGLALGLLAGAAYYTRRGVRPGRGVLVSLALLAPTLAYAAHPIYSVRYYFYRYETAADDAERGDALRSILRLEPDNTAAAVELARLEDDPAPLDAIGAPRGSAAASAVAQAWLDLAERRLERDPEQARAFAARAAGIRNAAIRGWLFFGQAAEQAGLHDLADESFQRAYDAMKTLGETADLWRPALARLALEREREPDISDPDAFEARLALAAEAAPAPEQARPLLLAVWRDAEEVLRTAEGDTRKRMARALSAYLGALASGEREDSERLAPIDLRMAALFWFGAEDPSDPETREMAAGRFETAWHSARRTGNSEVERLARIWFEQQKIPLPEPELAEDEDGG